MSKPQNGGGFSRPIGFIIIFGISLPIKAKPICRKKSKSVSVNEFMSFCSITYYALIINENNACLHHGMHGKLCAMHIFFILEKFQS